MTGRPKFTSDIATALYPQGQLACEIAKTHGSRRAAPRPGSASADLLVTPRRPFLDAMAAELRADLGLSEPSLDQLARAGFAALGLPTFLTTGPKEARAWTIKAGATAPEAAGAIHSDFQRGFIKAEVVPFDDLMAAGSLAAARSAGKARIEGKDYIMRDGDVVEFRFSV